jgi:hypothetical protein
VSRHPRSARARRFHFASYVLFNNASLALTTPLLLLFVSVRSMKLATANVLSLLVLGGVCFVIADVYARGLAPTARSVRKLLRRRDLGPPAV